MNNTKKTQKQRVADFMARLKEKGGARKTFTLTAESIEGLAKIKKDLGVRTDTDALNAVLSKGRSV